MTTSDNEHSHSASTRPTPLDLPNFVPWACYQLEAPFTVKVLVSVQGEYLKPEDRSKKPRRSVGPAAAPAPSDSQDQESEIVPQCYDDTVIVLKAIMDTHAHLVELVFFRCVEIPRLLLKIIGCCLPFQSHLYRLTVRWGPLTTAGLYEFGKYLTLCQLSEVCLDDSPVAGRNYEVLLTEPNLLRSLSLARCKLDDDDCVKIAQLLEYPKPAAKLLSILNLVSNIIGDRGASALGQMLRSNRTLKYLNLAGNSISDIGAGYILKSLMEFLMTHKEIVEKRARFLDYLKLKFDVYKKCLIELNQSQEEPRPVRRKTLIRSAVEVLQSRAEAMTLELVGAYCDPFTRDCTTSRGGHLYCLGNLTLTCLNLSYNNLQYSSVVLLHDVLSHQSWISSKPGTGLLRINVDGNDLPVDCDEWGYIDELLDRSQGMRSKSYKRPYDKIKSRASRIN
ncbi:unnamed protein product [Chrysodeixis includens]|uniref:Uncharacterized protein n=1 Tax=Chrysodeixis includens TaxID=689277 RepID=A0A9N8PY48_CHRIL|nr:unnamed protein product [Chrysodeixis includens]